MSSGWFALIVPLLQLEIDRAGGATCPDQVITDLARRTTHNVLRSDGGAIPPIAAILTERPELLARKSEQYWESPSIQDIFHDVLEGALLAEMDRYVAELRDRVTEDARHGR